MCRAVQDHDPTDQTLHKGDLNTGLPPQTLGPTE